MNPITPKTLAFYVALLIGGLLFAGPGHSQTSKEADQEYINLGNIAFSSDYQLAEDRSFIIFTIKNQEYRTLSRLFGWVYLYRTGDDQQPPEFQLMNNPHQSATVIEGAPHRPGSTAQYRFLLQKIVPAHAKEKFTLRVSPKSLYYTAWEPPLKKETDKNKQ